MKKKVVKSFTEFGFSVIADFRAEERHATAHVYRCALLSYARYLGKKEVAYSDLTRPLLRDYQRHLCALQRKWNTVSSYLRALRALYHRAVDAGLTEGVYRLFKGLYLSIDSPEKRALGVEEMRALTDEERVENQPPEVRQAQRLLWLMVMLNGMPFVDLVHLRRSDLEGNVLRCHRQKTGAPLCITLLPDARRLIETCLSKDDSSPYLLDLLPAKTHGEAGHRAYQNLLRRFNLRLRTLARCCGVSSRVSSYTARHTWATVAKQCGVPIAVISQAMGHSSVRTTEIYLKKLDKSYTDKANKITNLYIQTGKMMSVKF